jgi:hypothetical protein
MTIATAGARVRLTAANADRGVGRVHHTIETCGVKFITVAWPDGAYGCHRTAELAVLPRNEVFNLHGAWRLVWDGSVPATCWRDRGGAEAQLWLLETGYSALCADGTLRYVGQKAVRG